MAFSIFTNPNPKFAPVSCDQTLTQFVLGLDISTDDQLTAAIVAGGPYFTVSSIDVCNWDSAPPVVHRPLTSIGLNERRLSDPVASSDGVKPLTVKKGQYARVWVSIHVPKGTSLAADTITGSVVLSGTFGTVSADLKGTYLRPLIGKVVVTPTTARPGEPIHVQVYDAQGAPVTDPSVTVTIQGVPSASRYLQYAVPGTRTLVIRASSGARSETEQVAVTIEGTPLLFRESLSTPQVQSLPMINTARVQGLPYAAALRLGSTPGFRRFLDAEAAKTQPAHGVTTIAKPAIATELSIVGIPHPLPSPLPHPSPQPFPLPQPIATTYKWEFGDGTTETTTSPTVTHDFFPAIKAGRGAQSFDVTCTAMHDNITVKRTVTVHSAYDLCRRTGVIVPHITGDAYAPFQSIGFPVSLIVHNLEDRPLTLNQMAFTPLSDDPSVMPPPPRFVAMRQPLTIAANGVSALCNYVPLSELRDASPSPIAGFTIWYMGSISQADGSSMPVRFTWVQRISTVDARHTGLALRAPGLPIKWSAPFIASNWDMIGALAAVSGLATKPGAAISAANGQTLDPATRTIAIALTANPHSVTTKVQVQSAALAGMTSIVLKANAQNITLPNLQQLAPVTRGLIDPLHPPPVTEGNECFPDVISDADAAAASAAQLVCQLTTETANVTIPAAFQNALAGDIILSPSPVGNGDMITALFRALKPAQHHGHCGIMTANFYEITHCTASGQRISENLNENAIHIPTSFNAQYLQYGWPGSITQSIDDTIRDMPFVSPENKTYYLCGFNVDEEGQEPEIIPPLVVKPRPEHEGEVRSKLRQIANTAKSKGAVYDQNGVMTKPGGCYYSFYSYTNPERAEGFTALAGADAGWAKGMSPAVCSAFVWMAIKANGIPLVTSNIYEKLSDFSPAAVAGGVQVGPATLPTKDGLVFYPADERLDGANAMRAWLLNQAQDKEFGLGTIPGVNDLIAGPLADQLINCFANGNADRPGDSSWKNPGDANAVSPDNIIWWNPNYYGYAEPLQFLPSHDEQYTVSRWKKVITWGTIKGKVTTAKGTAVTNAHVWWNLPGGDTYTAADGTYTLNHVPIGSYALKAQAVVNENGINGERTNGLGGEVVTLTATNPNITHDIVLTVLPEKFRRMDLKFGLTCDHGDANPFNKHGVLSEGNPYHSDDPKDPNYDPNWEKSLKRQAVVQEPGQTNSVSYTYNYNNGGYFRIDYLFTVLLKPDLSLAVTVTATMYDANSGHFVGQSTNADSPLIVPKGETRDGNNTLEHRDPGFHNGPANMTFRVTNSHQTG